MTQALYGKPVVAKIFGRTLETIKQHQISGYVAIFMFGENHPGQAYVKRKQAYAAELGLNTKVYTLSDTIENDIQRCNTDANCLGIIVQLPLPDELKDRTQDILNLITPAKDVDCLGEKTIELSLVGNEQLPVMPATPAAVLELLDYYAPQLSAEYTTLATQKIAMIGEGVLVGKSLAILLQKRGAEVYTFNEFSDKTDMRTICIQSDMIISATGKIYLVDETFVRDDQQQLLVDVGRGYKDSKPVGDINIDAIKDKVAAYTPVPGGVGPITVACLFDNVVKLWQYRNK